MSAWGGGGGGGGGMRGMGMGGGWSGGGSSASKVLQARPDGKFLTIGRLPGNDIVISNQMVSGQHGAIGWGRSVKDGKTVEGWVAVDGPYNEHLVRDVGGLNLALAFVAILALVTGSVAVARAAGGTALIFGVPHLLYHATHLDPFDTGDAIAMLGSLGIAALAAVVALSGSGGRPAR